MPLLRTLKYVDSIQYRPAPVGEMRLRALNRLYARRDAVDALIRSLELYERTQRAQRASCVPITSEQKCS